MTSTPPSPGSRRAIVLYTLVMAMLMVTGGKIGSMIGRKRAFTLGLVIYCTRFAHDGPLAQPRGADPRVVGPGGDRGRADHARDRGPGRGELPAGRDDHARTASWGPPGRSRSRSGPLIGGLATTYASWRWVFAGEVVVGAGIVLLGRRMADTPVEHRPHLDLLGSVLWALGMGLVVFGVLFSSEWGLIRPKEDGPSILGLSPVVWLILGGLLTLRLFMGHVRRLDAAGAEPLVTPSLFRNHQLNGGLLMFFFQFVVMMGVFFVIPLYLSVALGLSAIDTGIKITPLSITMLLAAAGVPKFFPSASPRRVVELGLAAVVIGIVVLMTALDVEASASIVTVPLLLMGLGFGCLASQLGAVTVSAVPDEQSPEVGGLQNTATQFGASIGAALAGAILITSLTSSFLSGIAQNPDVPPEVSSQATVELESGIPFISDADLEAALEEAGATPEVTQAVVDENEQARLDGLRSALALLALIAVVALFFTRRISEHQPGTPVAAGSP